MIGVRCAGRLGNQLFQYAFAYSKAQLNGTTPFIDDWGSLKYFEVYTRFRWVNYKNRIYLAYLLIRRKINIIPLEKYDGYVPDLLTSYVSNFLHIGYFQSSLYFNSASEQIHNLYKIREDYKIAIPTEPYLAIHLRFGDYKAISQKGGNAGVALSKDYFRKALDMINIKYARIIAVSDEPELIAEYLGINEVEIYSGNEIEDFQILSNADSLIISNSTFSWWAAFLNKSCKQVVAPKQWIGSNENVYPRDIFAGLCWDLI
jgi:hypothetical protein